jgi:hypothetical protein
MVTTSANAPEVVDNLSSARWSHQCARSVADPGINVWAFTCECIRTVAVLVYQKSASGAMNATVYSRMLKGGGRRGLSPIRVRSPMRSGEPR